MVVQKLIAVSILLDLFQGSFQLNIETIFSLFPPRNFITIFNTMINTYVIYLIIFNSSIWNDKKKKNVKFKWTFTTVKF